MLTYTSLHWKRFSHVHLFDTTSQKVTVTHVQLSDMSSAKKHVEGFSEQFFKDPVLPITHCALTIIGGHFLDVEKSEN